MFDEALKVFDQVMQSGVKLQKETSKCWTEIISDSSLPNEWQEKAKKAAAESMNLSQVQLKEIVKIMEDQSKAGMDLLQKALSTAQSKDLKEGQAKTRELWEGCFESVRNNAQTLIKQNAKALENWQNLMSAAMVK